MCGTLKLYFIQQQKSCMCDSASNDLKLMFDLRSQKLSAMLFKYPILIRGIEINCYILSIFSPRIMMNKNLAF